MAWALDIGTTHTALARWDGRDGRPRLVELPASSRVPQGSDPLRAPRVVPSATHLLDPRSAVQRLGRLPVVARRWHLGAWARIGKAALQLNEGHIHPEFAASFKPWLGRAPLRPLARVAGQTVTAREVAGAYLRELLHQASVVTGERPRELVLTSPVEAYERYRAELQHILGALGVRKVHWVDEPVAAALGYGVALDRVRRVLVVDFGGGTLDVAVVRLEPMAAQTGTAAVLGKAGRPLGGDHVDEWLLEQLSTRLGYRLPDPGRNPASAFWYRLALAEAREIKEELFFERKLPISLTLPDDMRTAERRVADSFAEYSRDDLTALLEDRGLYKAVQRTVADAVLQSALHGVGPDDLDDVLITGGSSLLPGVYSMLEHQFGRDRVRAWQPFEAVSWGACALAADDFAAHDFIVHDYALVTHDRTTRDKRYTLVVPRGTRVPAAAVWRKQLVPTCASGLPESTFKLVICEIGAALQDERRFAWDDSGQLHRVEGEERLVVPLNASAPTLGTLDPPHRPNNTEPRLELSLSVDADRWLSASVFDLRTQKWLMQDHTVVRLL